MSDLFDFPFIAYWGFLENLEILFDCFDEDFLPREERLNIDLPPSSSSSLLIFYLLFTDHY